MIYLNEMMKLTHLQNLLILQKFNKKCKKEGKKLKPSELKNDLKRSL